MAQTIIPFNPAAPGVTVNLVAGVAPSSVQFNNLLPQPIAPSGNQNQTPPGHSSRVVRIYNAGPNMAFIDLWGGQGQNPASINTGYPMPPNTERLFTAGGNSFLAAVTAGGAATLYATPGEGGIH